MKKYSAYWTYDPIVNAYYFAPSSRTKPPYLKQVRVEAILDVAKDGTLAGVEIIDPNAPPPPAKPSIK